MNSRDLEIVNQRIEQSIYLIRGYKVILSFDLAELYAVEARTLTQAVKRNIERFPSDFMFQLTADEVGFLRTQNVILSSKWGEHPKYRPFAFTQEGVAMLSSVLSSRRAVEANIAIMRTFVHLREMMSSHRDLERKISALERRYDAQFKVVFNSIREMIQANSKKLPSVPPKKGTIGFGR